MSVPVRHPMLLLTSLLLTMLLAGVTGGLLAPRLQRRATLAALSDPARQQHALDRLAETLPHAPDREVQALLSAIEQLDDPNVVLRVAEQLDRAGHWHPDTVSPSLWRSWLGHQIRATGPHQADIRRSAAHRLADLAPNDPHTTALLEPLFGDPEPTVRLAALETAARWWRRLPAETQSRWQTPLTEARTDPDPPVAHFAHTLLACLEGVPAPADMAPVAAAPTPAVALWRELLSLPPEALPAHPPAENSGLMRGPFLAWHHRQGLAALQPGAPGAVLTDPAAYLAALEGAAGDRAQPLFFPLPPPPTDASALQRLAHFQVAQAPDPTWLLPLCQHPQAILRDLAATVIAERLAPIQARAFALKLLDGPNDQARQCAAILLGLMAPDPQALEQLRARHAAEQHWPQRQVLGLGLWLQGQGPTDLAHPRHWLHRRDLPSSTAMLALLHREPTLALDHLLLAPIEPRIESLITLLGVQRGWLLVCRALPKTAPAFWIWGDPALMQQQLCTLRVWYLLHRAERSGDTGG